MTTESYLWSKKLKPFFKSVGAHATRHEDKLSFGIPDVSYGLRGVNGWIEMKARKAWPKDKCLAVPFKKFTTPQRRFLKKRDEAGSHCYMMLIVGKGELLLFNPDVVDLIGEVTQDCLYEIACYHSVGVIKEEQLASLLSWR